MLWIWNEFYCVYWLYKSVARFQTISRMKARGRKKWGQKTKIKAHKTVDKFWCTDSFNCSIVCIHGKILYSFKYDRREEAPLTTTMASTSKTNSMPYHKCRSPSCSACLSVSFAFFFYLSSFCCFHSILKSAIVYKSDLLVAIDKLKQCIAVLSLIRLPLLVHSCHLHSDFNAKKSFVFLFRFSFVHFHSLLCSFFVVQHSTFGINRLHLRLFFFQTKQNKQIRVLTESFD